MTIERFWEIIEQAGQDIEEPDEQANNVTKILVTLEPEEIISFDRHFDSLHSAAYRWDVWAVAYIVNGGCSDDGFVYFRCWLIAQGKDFYEAVLRDPVKVAERVEDDEDVELEMLLYSASDAYKEKTGQEIPQQMSSPGVVSSGEPQGEPWAEDDLERLYPDLCARFYSS